MKKLLALLLLLVFLPMSPAAADTKVSLVSYMETVSYSFYLPNENFVMLTYSTTEESGKMVLYAEDGNFSGSFTLPYTPAGGSVRVKVEKLGEDRQLASGSVKIAAWPDYREPTGKTSAKVTNLSLSETSEGFRYSFRCDGTDFVYLRVRNKQESFTAPVYPDEYGNYSGDFVLPLTYARTLSTVQVLDKKGVVKAEDTVRKGYQAPEPVERQEGRLSGVTVCIDPGHQEDRDLLVVEPLGPGLVGSTAGSGGMAQGVMTNRKESIVVLEIGMVLRDELLRQGATVVMTRERQDVDMTNQERCQVAADAGADIMLRLHADTRQNNTKQGFSVYAPFNSTYARAVADPATYRTMGEMMIDALKTSVGLPLEDKYGFVTLSDQFVGNNWAQMTCFLIELGYMSTPREDYLLSCPVYQQWPAEGMAQGVYEIALYRGWIEE